VNSSNFLTRGATLVGLYDTDESVIGTEVAGHVVQALGTSFPVAKVAVITVPPTAAQEVTDSLVASGVNAILNFAPQVLRVPLGVAVHYVDFSIELQILMYHVNNGTGPLGGGLLHSLGISNNPAKRLLTEGRS
jgi:redox-sensing transcriptional repressor